MARELPLAEARNALIGKEIRAVDSGQEPSGVPYIIVYVDGMRLWASDPTVYVDE